MHSCIWRTCMHTVAVYGENACIAVYGDGGAVLA